MQLFGGQAGYFIINNRIKVVIVFFQPWFRQSFTWFPENAIISTILNVLVLPKDKRGSQT